MLLLSHSTRTLDEEICHPLFFFEDNLTTSVHSGAKQLINTYPVKNDPRSPKVRSPGQVNLRTDSKNGMRKQVKCLLLGEYALD